MKTALLLFNLIFMLKTDFWKKYFEVYDVLTLLIPYQELLDDMCEALEIKPGELVLEAGCGTGNLALKIKERGGNVIGLDNCQPALDIYRKKDPSANSVLADLSKPLPFADNYFDKITSCNTLYTFPLETQKLILKEFLRILEPGGKIAVENPVKGWSAFRIYEYGVEKEIKQNGYFGALKKVLKLVAPTVKVFYYNSKIKNESNYNFLKAEEQIALLENAGFHEVSSARLTYAGEGILNTAVKI